MTTETAHPLQSYTVAGLGPYAIPWPYAAGTIVATVIDALGIETVLTPDQAAPVDPESTTTGNLWFEETGDVAALYAGYTLRIARATPAEQGWAGASAREIGLEGQLDALTRIAQELLAAGEVQDARLDGLSIGGLPPDLLVASQRVLGRMSGGTGGVEQLTGAQIASLTGMKPFATRAAFVAWNSTASVSYKQVAVAEGRAYRYTGAAAISDLAGWEPLGEVTPEHWGADNTGVASASTAINAALAYLSTGGILACRGTYKLTASLQFFSHTAMIAIGFAKLVRGGDGFTMVRLNDGNNGPLDYCLLEGFEIDGKNGTYTSGGCVQVRGTFNVVRGCYIHNSCGNGIALSGSLGGTYVAGGTTTTITLNNTWTLTVGQTVHLQFEGAVPDGDYVVASVLGPDSFTITTGSPFTETGFNANLQTCDTNYNLIEGNRITDANSVGISMHTAAKNTIRRNHVQSCTAEGVTIDNESFRNLVEGNTLVNNCSPGGAGGIGTGNGDMSRIVGNYIDMSGSTSVTDKPCISLGNAAGDTSNYVIMGNTLIGSPMAAVWLRHDAGAAVGDPGYYTSTGVTITGNNILNCLGAVRIDAGCDHNVVRANSGNNAASREITNSGAFNSVDGQTDQWLLRHSAGPANVTGDGTLYTIPFDTTSQLHGDATVAGGIVTVAKTGMYQLAAACKLSPGAGTTFATIEIISSSAPAIFQETAWAAVPPTLGLSVSGVLYLTAGETVQVKIRVGGAGSLNSGLAASLPSNNFSGALLP